MARDRPLESLQAEIAEELAFDEALNFGQEAIGNENVAGGRLVTEASRQIYDGARSGVVPPILVADRSECREARTHA